MFSTIKTSQELRKENVELLLNEFVGAKLLERKDLQSKLKEIDTEIAEAKQELIDMMRETGVKEASLDEDFSVIFLPENFNRRLFPKKKLIDTIRNEFANHLTNDQIEEIVTSESKIKEHIRIVNSDTV